MSLTVPPRSPIRLAIGAALVLLGMTGCRDSLPTSNISSTPVATPIVVSNSSASSTPSPHPEIDLKANAARTEAIKGIITRARQKFRGRSSVVFIDMEADTRLDFDSEARYESASLAKLVILAELYRQFQVGDHKPEEMLTLLESQKVGGSGHLQNEKEGGQHSLRELAEAMITESDNTATQMLTDLMGRDKIEASGKSMGLTGTTLQRDIYDFAAIDKGRDNYITAKDAALFLSELARQEIPGSEQMHEILERQKRNDIIGKDFPDNVRVAHKTGELEGILHDAAIIYAPRGAFILVVLSDGIANKDAAKKSWADMSFEILELYQDPSPTPSATITP